MDVVPDVDHQPIHDEVVPDILDSPIPSGKQPVAVAKEVLPRLHLIDEHQQFR